MRRMGKANITIKYVTWRDGRPRFWPSKSQRALGYKGKDLRHGKDGAWFSADEALAWSKALGDELRAQSAEASQAPRLKTNIAGHTISQIVDGFLAQPKYKGVEQVQGRRRRKARARDTVRTYENAQRRLQEHRDGLLWNSPAATLSSRSLERALEEIEIAHGLATTRHVRALLSGAFKWACVQLNLRNNPVPAIELPVPEGRVRFGTVKEMHKLVEAADHLGRHSIGDSIILGLWSGQRQGDRLALSMAQRTTHGILFRQAKKRGAPLLIPEAPELVKRIEDVEERRRKDGIIRPEMILDENTHKPFASDWYRKVFKVVRDFAATGKLPKKTKVATWPADKAFTPLASLADFNDQDLRDTAVTWLALAGNSIPLICSITGHSEQSALNVLRHYLGYHPDMARTAIGNLVDWYDEQTG
ncbi:MAG: hypothetical protein AAF468_22655 [Pseudomonadota bacterium]